MRTHIPCGSGILCGSNSLTAFLNRADCSKCENRMDVIIKILMDAATGQDVKARASKLLQSIGYKIEGTS